MAAMDPQPEMDRPPSERIANEVTSANKRDQKMVQGAPRAYKILPTSKTLPRPSQSPSKNAFAKNITLGSIFFTLFEILT